MKNKIAFIDGNLPQPQPNLDNSHLSMAYLLANNLVLSWLMNSIMKEIYASLLYFTNVGRAEN